MQFMLLIHGDEHAMMENTKVDASGMSPEYAAYNEAMTKAGVVRGGERLRPTATATKVTIRDGKTELLDGPYVDTKEQFGGYYLIDVDSLDDAVSWAARCPAAHFGTVEVRPIWSTR